MEIDEIKELVIKSVTSSGLLKINIDDFNLIVISDDTFDVTVDNNPLGVRVKVNDNDKSFALTFDTNRMKKNKPIDVDNIVDSAIDNYLNGQV
jgi:hypothetical protein